MDIGDVVRIDLETAADKDYWRPLCEIDGVVLERDDTDGALLISWTKECGLCLHWNPSALVLILEFSESARQIVSNLRARHTTAAA